MLIIYALYYLMEIITSKNMFKWNINVKDEKKETKITERRLKVISFRGVAFTFEVILCLRIRGNIYKIQVDVDD